MLLKSFIVALGASAALAAPVEQQPLKGNVRHHAGPHKVTDPYTPDNRNPYDKKIDSQGEKLHPLPWVRTSLHHNTTTMHTKWNCADIRSETAMAQTYSAHATQPASAKTQT